jgi:cell division protein ZapE
MANEEERTRTVEGLVQAMVEAGELTPDPEQLRLARRLDRLDREIAASDLAVKGSALGWLFGRKAQKRETIRGLYVWGEVGRGKTMLMDLFFEVSPVGRKRRAHFHAFMADAQDRIHRARQDILAGRVKGDDPIQPVAEALAAETRLLCFDEFAVYDIADAMVLGRLFEKLFDLGTVVVATSNVAPDRLYWGGLNRALFLPFIDLLKRQVDVVELSAATDYRMEKTDGETAWRMPLSPETDATMEEMWFRITGHRPTIAETIPFRGREIAVPQACGGFARFDFDELCDRPMSAADYVQIARRYHTVMIERIPALGTDRRNAAKRLINLVDALYDRHVRVIASAAVLPEAIWSGTSGAESFEFARTISRLTEMRSAEYAQQPHLGDVGDLPDEEAASEDPYPGA